VGSDQTLTQNTLTVYPSGDVDSFRINATETDGSCGCGFPFLDEDYNLNITLTAPAGTGSYTICTGTSCGLYPAGSCQTTAAGSSTTVTLFLDGECPGPDSYSIYVRITRSPALDCHAYTLTYNFDAGYSR